MCALLLLWRRKRLAVLRREARLAERRARATLGDMLVLRGRCGEKERREEGR